MRENTVFMHNGDLLPVGVFEQLPDPYRAANRRESVIRVYIQEQKVLQPLEKPTVYGPNLREATFRLQLAMSQNGREVYYWHYLETRGHVDRVHLSESGRRTGLMER